MTYSQCSNLNVNVSDASEEAVIGGDLKVTFNIYTEDLVVNDIYDYDQGYIYCADDFELDDAEQIRADTNNLVLVGGTDSVIIGGASVAGSNDDLYVVDDLDVNGTKNCVVNATDSHTYNFSAIESPEIWFEEKLSEELIGGKCEIKLDKRFIASTVIDETHPLHVIATPTSNGSLWIEKLFDKVIVHGDCTTFDITISAKRLNYEDVRFDEMIYDNDLDTIYKKRKKDLFLEKKPIKLQIKTIKEKQHQYKNEIIQLMKEKKEENKKPNPNEEKIKLKDEEEKVKKAKLKIERKKVRELSKQINEIDKKNGE